VAEKPRNLRNQSDIMGRAKMNSPRAGIKNGGKVKRRKSKSK
jgi:hypothetical protein